MRKSEDAVPKDLFEKCELGRSRSSRHTVRHVVINNLARRP